MTQITDYVIVIAMIIVAVCQGISTAIHVYQKETKKPLPKQLMTIDQIAEFVVDEAATFDVSGAEKKIKAVEALMDQAKAEGKPITKEVAKGAVQNAYNKKAAKEEKKATPEDNEQAVQIGFVSDTDE